MTPRRNLMMLLLIGPSLFAAVEANGATITTDTVLGPDHPFPEQTITVIDGLDPPTLVTVMDGALVGDVIGGENIQVGFDVFGESVIEMMGGTLRGAQQAALLHDHSTFHMFEGLVQVGSIDARDSSRAVFDGGYWGEMRAFDSSRVQVNGGRVGAISSVSTFGEAHAAINAAKLDFRADEFSTMVINAGFFEGAEVLGNAEVLVNGGSFVTGLRVSEDATVRMRDLVTMNEENVDVSDNAVVHVYGTNLRFETDDENHKLVLGDWPNGDDFGFRYRLFDQGQIILHEVPEPGSWALLAVGALGVFSSLRRGRGHQ